MEGGKQGPFWARNKTQKMRSAFARFPAITKRLRKKVRRRRPKWPDAHNEVAGEAHTRQRKESATPARTQNEFSALNGTLDNAQQQAVRMEAITSQRKKGNVCGSQGHGVIVRLEG